MAVYGQPIGLNVPYEASPAEQDNGEVRRLPDNEYYVSVQAGDPCLVSYVEGMPQEILNHYTSFYRGVNIAYQIIPFKERGHVKLVS